ncbi:GNAT family N-acetyltransferase [Bacillus sp. A301a_S52]|nr:GNAT family N-acetyltransferase [Bacillus sp. A301a_S52]
MIVVVEKQQIEVSVAKTEHQLEDVYRVRREVFVNEQGVCESIEIDDKEQDAIHFIVYVQCVPAGAGRIRLLEGVAKVERVCVLQDYRKHGVGALLMEKMEEVAEQKGVTKLSLNAQKHAEAFYKKTGYQTVSDTFYDAGILHVRMEKEL